MRSLERNQSLVWIVEPLGETEILDSDGFKTGEFEFSYTVPKQVRLALYPSTGTIVEQLFGKDASFDMVATSCDIVLTEDTLIFINEPTANYDKTYDYRMSSIKKSINTYNYGLRNRT